MLAAMSFPKAYLAGPDVFLPNPEEFAKEKKDICASHGIQGVFPLDKKIERGTLSLPEFGLVISRENEALIKECQLVIAHLTPFRGPSADVGTAYEMGFARALGLKIFGYTNVKASFVERTRSFVGKTSLRDGGFEEDSDHMSLESFELVDNLMLAGGIVDSGGILCDCDAPRPKRYTALEAFEQCVVAAAKSFR
jgi:nucleoside 2-deoxyribosyltransferase